MFSNRLKAFLLYFNYHEQQQQLNSEIKINFFQCLHSDLSQTFISRGAKLKKCCLLITIKT